MAGSVIQGYFPHGFAHNAVAAQPFATQLRVPPNAMNHAAATRGQPLPAGVLQKMEALFGASFADVRVHVGPHVSALGAVSFTQGSHIHFAPNHYDPESPRGHQLIGRELMHVVQQRAGRVRNPFNDGVAVVRNPALDAEAERMALRAAMPAPRAAVQRLPAQTGGSRFVPVRQSGVTRPPIVQRHAPLRGILPRTIQRLTAGELDSLVDLVDNFTVKGLRFDCNDMDIMEHNTATIAPHFFALDLLVTKENLLELRDGIRDRLGMGVFFAAPRGRYVKPAVAKEAKAKKAVLSGMKRSAFKAAVLAMGCEAKGQDGQNHDRIFNPDTKQTTALGIGGHGDVDQTTSHIRTYLDQLGISVDAFLASLK